uniref:Uncharacterized protein n=1 Tax=virus sp. ctkyY8 TaxID=2827995 RepID=A0A8S5REG5_9VIRU|nr:MAG TPA: hypothetical protein [virus sp. ctkyY8]
MKKKIRFYLRFFLCGISIDIVKILVNSFFKKLHP